MALHSWIIFSFLTYYVIYADLTHKWYFLEDQYTGEVAIRSAVTQSDYIETSVRILQTLRDLNLSYLVPIRATISLSAAHLRSGNLSHLLTRVSLGHFYFRSFAKILMSGNQDQSS